MSQTADAMHYREAKLSRANGPQSIDLDGRSVEAVGASETPVVEYSYRTGERLPTVLLMSGCQLPGNGQLPLLDNHSRWESSSVIGSYRDIRIDKDRLIGRAYFTSSPEVEPVWTRVREGHITDLSVGRVDLDEGVTIPDGQSAVVEGRTFTGPLRVITKWQPKEMSVTPIGADHTAKMRSQSAAPVINDQHEETIMADETTRAAEAAPAPPAAQSTQATAPAAPAPETRTSTDAGFNRALEIVELCNRHGIEGEQRSALLNPELTMDQVRAQVLDFLSGQSRAQAPGYVPPRIERGADELDKFRAAATAGLFIRSGLPLDGERGLTEAAQTCGWTMDGTRSAGSEFVGYSLREIARECLKRGGHASGGDPLQMIGRALTASDLPVLMSAVANKALFEGYEGANETWELWADGTGSVSDFKTNTIAMASEFDDLDQIVDDAGYKYGERTDAKETYQIGTFGKLAAITRTVIINDDLNSLTDMYGSMGEAAARKIGDCPYGVLTANAAMRDSVALFHANHGNLGTSGVISESTIGEAIKLAGLQKGLKSKQYLNIPLQYFVGPKAIEGAAEIFFASQTFSSDNKGSTRTNIYGGSRFARAYDARLDAASSTAYYFLGPKRKTVRVFFLNGNRTPYLEQRTGWTVDGVEYKVRIDCVAKAVDWKAMVKNAGA